MRLSVHFNGERYMKWRMMANGFTRVRSRATRRGSFHRRRVADLDLGRAFGGGFRCQTRLSSWSGRGRPAATSAPRAKKPIATRTFMRHSLARAWGDRARVRRCEAGITVCVNANRSLREEATRDDTSDIPA